MSALDPLVQWAKTEFGEPEFTYSKKRASWTRGHGPRSPASHWIAIGAGQPVSKEEYDANIEESKRNELEAFMGRLKRSYWRYEATMSKPGWRERLIDLIKNYPSDSASGSNS
jgi:hypothetical protein